MNGPDFTHRRIKMEPVDKAMHAASYSQMSSGPADKATHAANPPVRFNPPVNLSSNDTVFVRRTTLLDSDEALAIG